MKRKIHLVDLLTEAEINAPSLQHVEIQRIIINREPKTCLFQHPDSTIIFPEMKLGKDPKMHFTTGINQSVWGKIIKPIHFKIKLIENEVTTILFDQKLKRQIPSGQQWYDHTLDLAPWEGKQITLQFTTFSKSHVYAWSAWGDPVLSFDEVKPLYPLRSQRLNKHIFAISADALSKRFIGCYGSQVKTPHIDRLANEGIVFEEAYTPSTVTLGAYTSFLTGLVPARHGVNSEWEAFPPGYFNLPIYLNSKGFETQLYCSEIDLGEKGFHHYFNQSFPSIANPAQDGALTLRRFERNFTDSLDRDTFAWLQFFDTHPPNLPEKPFSGMYYHEGNKSKKQSWKVYGIETMVDLDKHLPLVKKGHLISPFKERLLDCALAMQGKKTFGSDLYNHLINLGPSAYLDLGKKDFGKWLETEVGQLAVSREPNPEFIAWLADTREKIQFIERSITAWFSGIDDFNFVVAQHQASISYFDSIIGRFIQRLEEWGIYEQSIILLFSPHGEIMKYRDVFFHHHVPHFQVAEIPMIWKIPGISPRNLTGIASICDIFPTIQGLIKADDHFPCNGLDLSPYMDSGEKIPRKATVLYDQKDITKSIIQPPYIYTKSLADALISSLWQTTKGEEFLFEKDNTQEGMHPIQDDELIEHFRKLFQQHQDLESQ